MLEEHTESVTLCTFNSNCLHSPFKLNKERHYMNYVFLYLNMLESKDKYRVMKLFISRSKLIK